MKDGFESEADSADLRDVDDWKPSADDLDAEPRWITDPLTKTLVRQWRFVWEPPPGSPRASYVGKWVDSRDEALRLGYEWVRNGNL